MTPTIISAFLTYTLITAMTPGPNNILALSTATSYGFRQSVRVLAGMSAGFLFTMLLCAAFTFTLTRVDPALVHWLSWIGAAYILWLAFHIAMSQGSSGSEETRPVSFRASFALQFVNVKIILYGITALSTFVLPITRDLHWVVLVSVLLALIGTAGNVCWAVAGHLFQSVFQKYGRTVNLVLAALLVYCAVRMLI